MQINELRNEAKEMGLSLKVVEFKAVKFRRECKHLLDLTDMLNEKADYQTLLGACYDNLGYLDSLVMEYGFYKKVAGNLRNKEALNKALVELESLLHKYNGTPYVSEQGVNYFLASETVEAENSNIEKLAMEYEYMTE